MNKILFWIILTASFSLTYGQIDIVNDFDFSHCGYAGSEKGIPFVEAVYAIDPPVGDASSLIQEAIDKVSALPLGEDGFRGAVLLNRGTFYISGQLLFSASGVVIRGSGAGPDGTFLIATGKSRRTLIEVKGPAGARESASEYTVIDAFVSPGTEQLTLENAEGLKTGDEIFILRPSTKEWIDTLKMNRFVGNFSTKRLDWLPGTRDLKWDRKITRIENNTIFFNAPITTELDANMAHCKVVKYSWPGRIENIGIENLTCRSEYDSSNPKDEDHSWICINMSNVKNAWVRNLDAVHFASSAVMLQTSASYVTIDNCRSLKPVSEIGGLRRVSFYNGGQLNLIQNCTAENGRHDFVVGFCSAGPNVFRNCTTKNALSFSGSIESWACGALFENVRVTGNAIKLTDLKKYSQGAGWSASICGLWNCQAAVLEIDNPPFSHNYALGNNGNIIGNPELSRNAFHRAHPLSLFEHQLKKRLGEKELNMLIPSGDYPAEHPVVFKSVSNAGGKGDRKQEDPKNDLKKSIEIRNGYFTIDGKAVWGGHFAAEVWEGSMVPEMAKKRNAALTRFVPGRTGWGLTDDLNELASVMQETNRTMFVNRTGLWYDRRRKDHMPVKRMDGDVWGPFLEMPWARSGEGIAWDGLSKFDLTRFNPWYFDRIRQFGDLCDQNGLILFNQLYNNHNVVESASHWVDFPWRPANCVQDNGITEPPPFDRSPPSGDRLRIHIADEFYDVANPLRRDLHKLYIVKCLDELKGVNNVVYTPAFQYAGTLEFMKFFLDVADEWQKKNNTILLLALLTGKNVTDEILREPYYRDMISVIYTGYWTYFEDGTLFAPPAGENKAFREFRWLHSNEMNSGFLQTNERMVYKLTREYADEYPDKVIFSWSGNVNPLAVLMAGGGYVSHVADGVGNSPANLKFDKFVNEHLGEILWKMNPADDLVSDPENTWCLAEPGKSYLFYSLEGDKFNAELEKGKYKIRWFSPQGKALTDYKNLKVKGELSMVTPENKPALLLIKKN